MRDTRVWINGVADAALSALDRGVQYGDGLFETIAVAAGRPLLWSEHWARLAQGCARLGIPLPDEAGVRRELEAAATGTTAVAKLILTRGIGERGYRPPAAPRPQRIVTLTPWPEDLAERRRRGARVRWCGLRLGRSPALAGIKHLNRLEQVLARAEWRDEFDEGLLCDTDGAVIEATAANVFIFAGGTLYTPDVSRAGVAGVMRAQVLLAAQALGWAAVVQPLTRPVVEAAEEIFLTNSIVGIWPVTQIETRSYVPGRITQAVAAQVAAAGAVVEGG